jgi:hypothetical protein
MRRHLLLLTIFLIALGLVSSDTVSYAAGQGNGASQARKKRNGNGNGTPDTRKRGGSAPLTAEKGNGNGPARSKLMFDSLEARPEHIYLLANSSVVFGPDPKARSEEITFVGLVTVPKWPMTGYQRRTIENGREQIDLELTESELTGESYLLGGAVQLGEHPDLRSLGTITESALKVGAQGQSQQTGTVAAQGVQRKFRISAELAKIIQRNPNILWDDLLTLELRKLTDQADQIRRGTKRPQVMAPRADNAVDQTFRISSDVLRKIEASRDIVWDVWANEGLTLLAEDLRRRRLLDNIRLAEVAIIPDEFIVARKVLITTAKGILYNEAPVPVRGRIDSIPPVRTRTTPLGVNVFHGMELPVALLDKDGNIDGWFYSKAHMAYAVKPEAIERGMVEGSIQLRAGDRVEDVVISGPLEIHHGLKLKGAKNESQTEIEVIVLALRGRSELLGGDFMMIEAFSDRDRFSSGQLYWDSESSGDASFNLFLDIYTPSGKLANKEPVPVSGKVQTLTQQEVLGKGKLQIPILSGAASYSATANSELYDEGDKAVARIVKMNFTVAKRQAKK